MRTIVAAVTAYLIGSFPTADVIARMAARREKAGRAVDLREAGTRNPGALNAAKVLGTKWGAAVLAGDIFKGVVACALGRRIAADRGAYAGGIAAVYGHCLPVWSGFRGGKGVATSAGTSIVCFPAYMPFDLALAGASAWLTRGQAGTATYVASAMFTAAATHWWSRARGNLWGPKATAWLPFYAASTSAIIAYKFLTAPPMQDEAVAAASVIDADEMGRAVVS